MDLTENMMRQDWSHSGEVAEKEGVICQGSTNPAAWEGLAWAGASRASHARRRLEFVGGGSGGVYH